MFNPNDMSDLSILQNLKCLSDLNPKNMSNLSFIFNSTDISDLSQLDVSVRPHD